MALVYLRSGVCFDVEESREEILGQRFRGGEVPRTQDFRLRDGGVVTIRFGTLIAVADGGHGPAT